MSRLVTQPVSSRPDARIVDRKVFKSEAAQELREQPCRACGERQGVELNHLVSRGQRGDDVIENLVGLCTPCHHELHHGKDFKSVYEAIGAKLRPREVAYIVAKKGAGWLSKWFGVEAA